MPSIKRAIHFLGLSITAFCSAYVIFHSLKSYAKQVVMEPIQACVITRDTPLIYSVRQSIAQCIGWEIDSSRPICQGFYQPITVEALANPEEIKVNADEVSFYNQGRSDLKGHVEVYQTNRIVNAQTAYIYRDPKTNQVSKIDLLGEVKLLEPGRLIYAKKVTIDPQTKAGHAEDVLYRFNSTGDGLSIPAWGQASLVERFANKDYLMEKATYTTCTPNDNAWRIEADQIKIDDARAYGVARNARLVLWDRPFLYTPYLSFPTSRERKSGFLIPSIGNSNIGGVDFALPYYWNIAPNYDATITPHLYSKRGLMMGGEFRYLTPGSVGKINANFLPHDLAYKHFLQDNQTQYPQLRGASYDRWALSVYDVTEIIPDLQFKINLQQVSDDYYLQDFSSNLAVLTERQLTREAELSYSTEHWYYRGLVQSYQTLQPVNESRISDIYQRMPQLMALGSYDDLPFNSNLSIQGQFDDFKWPNHLTPMPEGPRYYLNPTFSVPIVKPWGFITPSVELVQNYYDMNNYYGVNNAHFSRTIPRYYVDSGLVFERGFELQHQLFTQTLEPRLFYLNVPYANQTPIPVFDASYLIFNTDQLFRTNRFSGLDRIGDANQLSFALSSRFISDETGTEKASFTIGQIRYFKDRQVKLCQSPTGDCVDNPFVLGYLSPLTDWSPLASRLTYQFNPYWSAIGDYVWDPSTHSTDNGHVDFHYQPEFNKLIGIGYSYMAMGDITELPTARTQVDPLHQINLSFAWPYNDRWSTLGAFGYNISKGYQMMSLLGIQYESCCWALRLIGGKTFQSLAPNASPQYNNNIYLQIRLKGLGSVGTSDPSSVIGTFIPGYVDSFHH